MDGEARVIGVLLVILDEGILLQQELGKVDHRVASTGVTDLLISLAKSLDKLLVTKALCFSESNLQSLAMLFLAK